jgi:hypothetical protein
MIGKLFRGYVEGVGSKTIAFAFAAIAVAFVAPWAHQKLGIPPDMTRELLYGLAGVAALVILGRSAVDVASGGKTTTQYAMTQKALQGLETLLPDGTPLDVAVKEIMLAMNRAQTVGGYGAAPAPTTPPAPAPAPVPPPAS